MCVQIVILDSGNSLIIAAVKLCLAVDHIRNLHILQKAFLYALPADLTTKLCSYSWYAE